MLEHMRLAKMSFDMWGALSPLNSKPPPGDSEEPTESQNTDVKESGEPDQASAKRTMSQAELESTLYKVTDEYSRYKKIIIKIKKNKINV